MTLQEIRSLVEKIFVDYDAKNPHPVFTTAYEYKGNPFPTLNADRKKLVIDIVASQLVQIHEKDTPTNAEIISYLIKEMDIQFDSWIDYITETKDWPYAKYEGKPIKDVISPLWDDMIVRQFEAVINEPYDHNNANEMKSHENKIAWWQHILKIKEVKEVWVTYVLETTSGDKTIADRKWIYKYFFQPHHWDRDFPALLLRGVPQTTPPYPPQTIHSPLIEDEADWLPEKQRAAVKQQEKENIEEYIKSLPKSESEIRNTINNAMGLFFTKYPSLMINNKTDDSIFYSVRFWLKLKQELSAKRGEPIRPLSIEDAYAVIYYIYFWKVPLDKFHSFMPVFACSSDDPSCAPESQPQSAPSSSTSVWPIFLVTVGIVGILWFLAARKG